MLSLGTSGVEGFRCDVDGERHSLLSMDTDGVEVWIGDMIMLPWDTVYYSVSPAGVFYLT